MARLNSVKNKQRFLIFDWGGVYTRGHLLRDFSSNLFQECGIDKEQIEKSFHKFEYPLKRVAVLRAGFGLCSRLICD
jgi:hypothetical protein